MSLASASADGVNIDSSVWLPVITSVPDPSFSVMSEGSGQLTAMSISMGSVSFRIGNRYGNGDWNKLDWVGAPVSLWIGEVDKPFSDYRQFFTGTLSGLKNTQGTAELALRTVEGQIDVPLLSKRYAGTGNSEGSTGLKGALKPRAHGVCYNVTPVKVDDALLIYQVHGYGAVQDIPAVYEYAQELAPALADVATWAELAAYTLVPGQWISCKALGMFRLGGRPDKLLTADVIGGAVDGVAPTTAGDIIVQLLKEASVGDPRIGDMSALDMDWCLYATADATIADTIKQAALDAGGWVFPDRNGVWQCGRWATDKPVLELRSDRTAEPLVQSINELNVTDPTWKVNFNYARCWTVHSESDISPALVELEGKLAAQDEVLDDLREQAEQAAADAEFAKNEITAMIADGILDRADKRRAVDDLEREQVRRTQLAGVYGAYNVASQWAAYDAAWTGLRTFMLALSPSIYDNSAVTPIDSAAYLAVWNTYTAARVALYSAITSTAAAPTPWVDIPDTDPDNPKPDSGATVGGTVGVDIRNPDGTVWTPPAFDLEEVQDAIDAAVTSAKAELNSDLSIVAGDLATAQDQVDQAQADLAAEVIRAQGAEGVLTTAVTLAKSTADGAVASLASTTTVLQNADTALANRATTLEAQLAGTAASNLRSRIITVETVTTNGTFAAASRATALEAQMAGTQSSNLNTRLSTVETVTTNGTFATASRATSLEGRATTLENQLAGTTASNLSARLGTVETVTTNGTFATASRASNIEAQLAGTTASGLKTLVTDETTARTTATTTLGNRSTALESQMAGTTGSALLTRISNEESTRASQTGSLATRASTLESQMAGTTSSNLSSRISTVETVTTNGTFAAASTVSSLSSTVGGLSSTVSTQAGTIANLQGRTASYLSLSTVAGSGRAQLTLHADANGGGGVDIVGDTTFRGSLNVGPDSGQRCKITDAGMMVYDSNNVLRVRVGVW